MALLRVYCGLVTAESTAEPNPSGVPLVAAMVDDIGRTLDVFELPDHPRGYAFLSSLLAERSGGPYTVAIASESDRHLVPRLLTAAGWALAFSDRAATDESAERFTDDLLDGSATPPQRRALGLARALQAGVLTATSVPVPPDLVDLKQVLAADGALATGRHAAKVALREVLRELYPAALRAYPDPSDPVAMAVIDALPDPGALTGAAGGRGREVAATIDEVTSRLIASGVADHATVSEAITALRVAIAETPRRSGAGRAMSGAVAQTVRQAVAAVRCFDAARAAIVDTLVARLSGQTPAAPTSPQVAAPQAAAPQVAPPVPAPAASTVPASPAAPTPPATTAPAAVPAPSAAPGPAASPAAAAPPVAVTPPPPVAPVSPAAPAPSATRPTSAPPPPPGITPIGATPPRPMAPARPTSSPTGAGADHRVPSPRIAPEGPPPGSRSSWPTNPSEDEWAQTPAASAAPPAAPVSPPPADRPARSVTPPWLADDLRHPEPPPLRLVEPTLPDELREELASLSAPQQPSLRLVDSGGHPPRSAPPVEADESDSDLLIFAQARSAWFSSQDKEATWGSGSDLGWRVAEQATRPKVGDRTASGLPRRVPHANLIPGSARTDRERPLRVVRDPASIAAHTSGYFNGWRRGQEIGGYPLGTRANRDSGGAWEFRRDDHRMSG